jgi:YVTN family beta-propeller protein
MADQLDARIRALVREVVDSAPAAPRFEEIEAGLFVPVARRRVTRQARVVVAIAACLAVALVIGGLLLTGGEDSPSVRTPARPPVTGVVDCAGKAYVNNQGDGTVSVITPATGLSTPITVGTNPGGVAVTPDGKHVYVTNQGDGTVSVITTATGVVSDTITVGNGPLGVAITPDGKHVYVVNTADGTVSGITTSTGVVSAPIPVGRTPVRVAVCPA